MLLCPVKGFAWHFLHVVRWVADKTGWGREGRLLLGHAQQVRWGSGGGRRIVTRPAPGCGSRFAGQAAPGVVARLSRVRVAGGGRPNGRMNRSPLRSTGLFEALVKTAGPVTGTIPWVDRAADAFREIGMSRRPWWRLAVPGDLRTTPGTRAQGEARGPRYRPPAPRRGRHTGAGAGHPVPAPAGWSWPEPPAGWTPSPGGSL